MTDRLYEKDAYIRRFTAVVTDCCEGKDHYCVELDRTAFYPEGGGQSGDTGSLIWENELGDNLVVTVEDTRFEEGKIVHVTDRGLPIGALVSGEICWEKRFDHMQNHSGEHIVSGLIHETFGYNNVGFHMGHDFVTIDLDGILTMDQLRDIERRANEAVYADVPVQIDCYTLEEAANQIYRSKKELEEPIRVVTIPGADRCACCGTHVARTGEIGEIRLFDAEHFHSGVRIRMLCGRRCYEYTSEVLTQARIAGNVWSASPLKLGESAQAARQAASDEHEQLGQLQDWFFRSAARWLMNEGDVVVFARELSPDSVRRLADAVMQQCGGICVALAGSRKDGYHYTMGSTSGDIRELLSDMNGKLSGHGGGRGGFAMGAVRATRYQIEEYFKNRPEEWKVQDL